MCGIFLKKIKRGGGREKVFFLFITSGQVTCSTATQMQLLGKKPIPWAHNVENKLFQVNCGVKTHSYYGECSHECVIVTGLGCCTVKCAEI